MKPIVVVVPLTYHVVHCSHRLGSHAALCRRPCQCHGLHAERALQRAALIHDHIKRVHADGIDGDELPLRVLAQRFELPKLHRCQTRRVTQASQRRLGPTSAGIFDWQCGKGNLQLLLERLQWCGQASVRQGQYPLPGDEQIRWRELAGCCAADDIVQIVRDFVLLFFLC